MYVKAAQQFQQLVTNSPRLTIALPTGNTPTPWYALITTDKSIDWSKVTVFMLDCYYPQEPANPLSFYSYIKNHLLDKVDLPPENFHILNSATVDPVEECKNYEKQIKLAGGLDLAVLGLGENCHIAFDEPGTPENSLTHLANVSQETVAVNNTTENQEFPTQALTMGIKTILSARKILMMAVGNKKALAVKTSLTHTPCEEYPSTFLQKHQDAMFLIDDAAGCLL